MKCWEKDVRARKCSSKLLEVFKIHRSSFRGTFDGRPVAVKRVVIDQLKLIGREIELLQKSDMHRNVVRYFCAVSSIFMLLTINMF
jgi:serine/threonine-protein kinase/endoribonuclease IRE1